MPTTYKLAAEALVVLVEYPDGTSIITIAGSGVGGLYPTDTMATVAAAAVRAVIAQVIRPLFSSHAEFSSGLDRIVDVAPAECSLWAVRVAEHPLGPAPGTIDALGSARADLADLLQILVDGDAGEAAVAARRFSAPAGSADVEIARLREDNARLRIENEVLRRRIALLEPR